MKIEDCKAGMIVLATKKTYIKYTDINIFLKVYPLGIAKIYHIFKEGKIEVGNEGKSTFRFYPGDLIKVK